MIREDAAGRRPPPPRRRPKRDKKTKQLLPGLRRRVLGATGGDGPLWEPATMQEAAAELASYSAAKEREK
eukprot:SAG22_NODE_4061_length_1401_cov_1.709677_1_plen_69_part_10